MHCPYCKAPVAKSELQHHKFSCRSCSRRIWKKRRPGYFHWLVLLLPVITLVTFGVLNFVEWKTGENEHYQVKNEFSIYGFPFIAKKKRSEFEQTLSFETAEYVYKETPKNVTYTDVPQSLYSNIGVALATTLLSWLGVLSLFRIAWYRHHFRERDTAAEFDGVDLKKDELAGSSRVSAEPKPKFRRPEVVPNSSQRRLMSIGAFCIGCSGVLLCLYVGASLARTLAELAGLLRSGDRMILLGLGAVSFLGLLLEVPGRILCVLTPNKGERLLAGVSLLLLFVVAASSTASVFFSLSGDSEGTGIDPAYQFGLIFTGLFSLAAAILFWFLSIDYAKTVAEHGLSLIHI